MRLVLQMLALLAAAFAAGFTTNAVRSHATIDVGSTDPSLLKYSEIERLSLDDAVKSLDQATTLFLDVRAKPEYDAGHVKGAISFPADDLDAAYAEIRDYLGAGVQTVVYGDATLPAVRAAQFLKARNHAVRVLDGGWRMWVDRALPTDGEAK